MSREEFEDLKKSEYGYIDVYLFFPKRHCYVLFKNSLDPFIRILFAETKTRHCEFIHYSKLETLKGDETE